MPKALHDRLERQARKLSLTGDRHDAYLYGTMDRIEKKHKKRPVKKSKKKQPGRLSLY